MGYAELHAHSAFSFLDGASLPAELVRRAAELELDALALTDHGGLAGVVQLAQAAREVGLPTVIGSELTIGGVRRAGEADPAGEHLVVLARGAEGYRRLAGAISTAQLASGIKGEAHYAMEDLAEQSAGQWMILTGCRKGRVPAALNEAGPEAAGRRLDELVELFGAENVAVELTNLAGPLDQERCAALAELGESRGLTVVATGQVHYARPADRQLADVLAAVRANASLEDMDGYLPSGGRYLRGAGQMRAIHSGHVAAVDAAGELGRELAFDLSLVAPALPPFPVPRGHTEATWLRELAYAGARNRYGERWEHPRAWEKIDAELDIITQLNFPGYFLIVHEIVEFCRSSGIFCQGRGSAANSAVCFALGITAVDAVRHNMLFERFLSPGRSGPPDIDIDIEAGRREEVIQHVYDRYGRTHAAQVANVITYRPKSAVRDAGRACGFDVGTLDAWSKRLERHGSLSEEEAERIDPLVADLARRMLHLPRHLGVHSGGMVMCAGKVTEVCPVEWATAPGRTVLQWDKEDCASAGLVKFDLLGLGMLTALRLMFTMIAERGVLDPEGRPYALHTVPAEDPEVYDLLCAADTVGVFQVESRAQMSTLPRLRPRTFYDIVIEVALIRPGPIQGRSVSPYLARRQGLEPVTYPHPLLEDALHKTLGVPLFQEQLMQIAIDAAGFSPAEADQLRKAMGAKRSHERMAALKDRLLTGMAERGIDRETGEEIYDSLKAFADFGFPESHSFSFAYLVYASAWMKVHHPEAFYVGLLGAQPMGFYSPQSLIADARRHGVRVARADVNYSLVEACLEETLHEAVGENTRRHPPHHLVHPDSRLLVRLGLSSVKGVGDCAERIVAERERGRYSSMADLASRCHLSERVLRALAKAGALTSLGRSRRSAMWAAGPLGTTPAQEFQPTLPGLNVGERAPALPAMSEWEEMRADVESTGISTGDYPTALVRPQLRAHGVLTAAELREVEAGRRVRVGGIVTHRQRPHTAQGTIFLSLEDETGISNIVCSTGFWRTHGEVARTSGALVVRGRVERAGNVVNVLADGCIPLRLGVPSTSRDFR
ncbi:MAG: error-prone DNA polymerase [Flaviflexus sp.]|nr:error-prone DNA polymerase [Flaviflexus sp.]